MPTFEACIVQRCNSIRQLVLATGHKCITAFSAYMRYCNISSDAYCSPKLLKVQASFFGVEVLIPTF